MAKKTSKKVIGVTVKEAPVADERIAKYKDLVNAIIKLIASEEPLFGQLTDEVKLATYNPIASKVLGLMLVSNMNYADRQFIFQLALQPLENVRERVVLSLEQHFNTVMNKALGKDYLDITIKDLDDKLKEIVPKS